MASSSTGLSGSSTGLTARWQKWHVTPSKSLMLPSSMNAEPSLGSERPFIHAPGAWHRMQYSPESVASWLAIVRAARHTGSRVDWAIMLVTHASHGSS